LNNPRSYIGSVLNTLLVIGLPLVVFVGLMYLISLYNYLLFHSLAELFSIAVGAAVFMLAWNTRRFMSNDFLFLIATSYLFAGFIDLVHTLAYKGMGLFPGDDANLPTQLWIAARYLQGFSFLYAALFFARRLDPFRVFLGFSIVAILLVTFIALGVFPDCYVDGLTPFKKISEYVISIIFVAGVLWLQRKRESFNPTILRFITISIIFTIMAELAFTFYVSVYGISNFLGHIFKIVAVYFVYKSIIETGLKQPFDLLFRDMKKRETELETSQKLLHELATHDLLTGLPNRRLFETRLTQAIEKARQSNHQDKEFHVQLILMDTDNFKNVNDLLGHLGGDEVLKEIARRLRAEARDGDTVARWGGDEFTLVLEDIQSVEDGERIAKRILTSMMAPMQIQDQSIEVTVSIGISFYPQHAELEEDLLRCADAALFRAKEKKNGYQIYNESMQNPFLNAKLQSRYSPYLQSDT